MKNQNMRIKPRGTSGYTLVELCVTLFIICLTASIVYSVLFVPRRDLNRERRAHCASNLKQIGLAALAYAQDNDETLPPSELADKQTGPLVSRKPLKMRFWLGQSEGASSFKDASQNGAGFLDSYLRRYEMCRCPETQNGTVQITWNTEQYGWQTVYMTSDLVGGAKEESFANPRVTAIAMDGATALLTTSHTAMGHAATRHSGGANYAFADGHVKWVKPESVFFPIRWSLHRTHREPQTGLAIGPDPSGEMTFRGKKYAATFHLR